MHNCEEFRERIAEQIIDREDLTSDPAFQHELLICSGCSDFYADSCEMMAALSLVDASVPAGAVTFLRKNPGEWGDYALENKGSQEKVKKVKDFS